MAKLEFYRQQTTPRVIAPDVGGLGRIQSGFGQAAEAIARGAAAAGQMIERRNLEIEKRREDEAAIDASSKAVELTSRWLDEEQRLRQEAEAADNFDGFTDTAQGRYQELVNEYLPNLKSDKARAWFTERTAIQGLDVQRGSMDYQARSSVAKTVRIEGETFNTSRRLVQVDPSKFSELSESLKLSASRITDKQVAAKFYDQNRALLAQDAAISAADRNPRQILDALAKPQGETGFAYLDALDADSVDNVKAAAERRLAILEQERRVRQAEAREALRTQIDDQFAYMSVGIMPDKLIPQSAFVNAGMADRYSDYRETYNASATLVSMSTMPRAEAAQKIAAMKPTAEAGAAGKLKRYEMVSESYARMVQAQENDPAAYLIERNPAIRSAYDAMNAAQTTEEQQAAAANFARIVDLESKRIGINNKSILPNALAADIVNRTFMPYQQGASTGAAAILAERQRWGSYWGRVQSQVAAKLPGDAAIIGAGMAEGPANRLIQMNAVSEADMAKLLPVNVSKKDLDDEITDISQDLEASWFAKPGSEATMLAIKSATAKLAIDYMRNGRGLNDAVAQAFGEVVGDRYRFAEINDSVVRIPSPNNREAGAGEISSSQIRTGLRSFTNDAIQDLGFGNVRGTYWQTSADDKSVMLMRDGQPLQNSQGEFIMYSWQEIRNRAATRMFTREQKERELLESSKSARGINP
jgi:hypothetical protein